ncbi:MAG: DNA-processing protein DprA [Candidatus Atribacteria bacterium]|nr:DNA-processing protein DprA [Candidatus Atribacteria bacterium]
MVEKEQLVYWLLAAQYGGQDLKKRIQQEPQRIAELVEDDPKWEEWRKQLIRESMALEEFIHQGGQLLTLLHPEYPEALRKTLKTGTPLLLYALGDSSIVSTTGRVAFAGSRKPLPEAVLRSRELAKKLVERGYIVVTGFAAGIDINVAQATLEAGGQTVAVLPQGLLRPETMSLVRKFLTFLNQGRLLFLSEIHPRFPWTARYAMMRNRIVTGLAEMLIVAQSELKEYEAQGKKRLSGTWQCAEEAYRRYSKPVYVLNLPVKGNQALVQSGIAQLWKDETLNETPPLGHFHGTGQLVLPLPPSSRIR